MTREQPQASKTFGSKRDARRSQILDALFLVIAERGMAGASISEIAEQAGIARGALHYFFDSKAEIAIELMQRIGRRYIVELEHYLDARHTRGSHDLVAEVVAWHFKGGSDDTARKLNVWIDFWGQAVSDAAIRAVVFDVQSSARRVIGRAMLLDEPRLAALDDADREAQAAAVLALIEGGLLQWSVARSHDGDLTRERIGGSIATASRAVAAAASLNVGGTRVGPNFSARPARAQAAVTAARSSRHSSFAGGGPSGNPVEGAA